jgi:hypothetical protein
LLASAAGLLVRSVAKLYAIRPGFATRGIAVIDVATPASLKGPDRLVLLQNIVRDLSALPGVRSAAVTQKLPLRGQGWMSGLRLPNSPTDAPSPYFRMVSRDYFATLGMPIHRGRSFDGSELTDSVASSWSTTLAKIFFPSVDPIGRIVGGTFHEAGDRIVGIVADVAEGDLKNPAVPARTLGELIAYARANPGKLSYGIPSLGSVNHLLIERLKQITGADITSIPFHGSPQSALRRSGARVRRNAASPPIRSPPSPVRARCRGRSPGLDQFRLLAGCCRA